ncbi:hypothetical protein ACFX5U_10710 [Sphingobacterium sp. SG20118]|nr:MULTISPECIES: hypothetical protein [Sphingobacterium]MDH5826636.1 hypothetical protein [Sphingobacterium faecium]
MKTTLIILLMLIAIVMIYLGMKAAILPPILTGAGFIVIAALFLTGVKK